MFSSRGPPFPGAEAALSSLLVWLPRYRGLPWAGGEPLCSDVGDRPPPRPFPPGCGEPLSFSGPSDVGELPWDSGLPDTGCHPGFVGSPLLLDSSDIGEPPRGCGEPLSLLVPSYL